MTSRKNILGLSIGLIAAIIAIAGQTSGWFSPAIAKELPAAKDEYMKLYDSYKNQTASHISGTIHLFDGEDEDGIKERETFEMIRNGRNFFSRFMFMQTISDGKILVQVDSINKIIIVDTHWGESDNRGLFPPQPVDILFSDSARFRLSGEVTASGNTRTLYLQSDFNPEFKTTSVKYDTTDYLPVQIELHWWKSTAIDNSNDPEKIWITRVNLTHHTYKQLDVQQLINNVINIEQRVITPAASYKNFKVHIL